MEQDPGTQEFSLSRDLGALGLDNAVRTHRALAEYGCSFRDVPEHESGVHSIGHIGLAGDSVLFSTRAAFRMVFTPGIVPAISRSGGEFDRPYLSRLCDGL